MADTLSKASLDSNRGYKDDTERNNRNKTLSELTNADLKRASSTSSHYRNINADLHARVKAFQKQGL